MFLKNKNIISKIRRSKVTDYAALYNDELLSFETRLHLGLRLRILFPESYRL